MSTVLATLPTNQVATIKVSGSASNTLLAASLTTALCIAYAGGVQATNTLDASIQPKGKALAHLWVGGGGLKLPDPPQIEGPGDLPSWVADIHWIRESSDVTVSRLAELFGVTRKAFYGWVEGANPKKGGSHVRIATLRALLAELPTDLHRTAFFSIVDDRAGDVSIRELFQRSVDEPDYQGRLDAKMAEISPRLQVVAQRLSGSATISRAFESDYPSV